MCVHGRRRFLPDLPLLCIFEALPLYKLLKTDRVCPRFAQLQAEALANRKMLTIFVGENVDRKKHLYESKLFFEPHLDTHTTREAEEEMAEHSALELQTLDQEMVDWLKSTFPRVTKVRFILGDDTHLAYVVDYVTQLLEHWAEKLESFGIWSDWEFDTGEYLNPLQSLFSHITDKLNSLQYLTISVYSLICIYQRELFHLDLSFLGRLKLFSTNINPMRLIEYMKAHESSFYNLPEIRLFEKPIDFNVQAKLLEMPTRPAAKITALYMDHISYQNNEMGLIQLKAFFAKFPALKWYSLSIRPHQYASNIGHLFIALSQLSHLTYLDLSNVPFYFPECFHSQEDLPPLSSLKTLSISGYIRNHHFLEPLGALDRLFPVLKCINVEVIVGKWTGLGGFYPNMDPSTLSETVSSLMLHFAQLALKGSFTVEDEFSAKYTDEFNFSDGGPFEDWQFDEGKVTTDDQTDHDDDQ